MLTITHTAAQGTLIEGTSRGDGTNEILKACGWRWGRSIGAWFVPRSRDTDPKTHIINHTADQLRAAGHQVETDIDATRRETAQVEADKITRQEDRVEALTDKAARKTARAEQLHDAAHREADRMPFGQPILLGHHSQRRIEKHYEKVHTLHRKAFDASDEAVEAEYKADAAAHHTNFRYNPVTVANRIERLTTDRRLAQRDLDGYTRTQEICGTRYPEIHPPAEGAHAERLAARIAQYTDELTYWEGIRTQQITTGRATNYSQETVSKGDRVKIGNTWYTVARANKKTVSVHMHSAGFTNTSPYAKIQDHQPASQTAS